LEPRSDAAALHLAVLMFNDGGFAAPINAYTYGSNPGRHLIAVMNKAYRRARVQFVMDEWRNDPNKWRYLNMGNVAKWQYCANKAVSGKAAARPHLKQPVRPALRGPWWPVLSTCHILFSALTILLPTSTAVMPGPPG
jgi:hypothetical protein